MYDAASEKSSGTLLLCAILLAIVTAVLVLSGLFSDSGGQGGVDSAGASLVYTVSAKQDVSEGKVKRVIVRVSLAKHYTRREIEQIAVAVVADITQKEKVHAIAVHFYGPSRPALGPADVGSVEWCPDGSWERSGEVELGDYRRHEYRTVLYITKGRER